MKIKKILIFTALCFLVNCARNTMPPSMPFEKTELRNNKVSNTPEIMIWTLQKDVFKYQKRMSGKYPVTWFDIKDNFNKRLIGDYRKDINEGFKIDDPAVLTFYEDYKTKTKWYKYIIDKSDENGFLIHSENNCGAQDWAADRLSRWLYFMDKEKELEEIEKREKIIKNDKFLFIFSNENRKVKVARELSLFQNPKAFEVLIQCIENKTESVLVRSVATASLKEISDLARFKNFIPRINSIIEFESNFITTMKREHNWREYDDHEYIITRLKKIIKIIEGDI